MTAIALACTTGMLKAAPTHKQQAGLELTTTTTYASTKMLSEENMQLRAKVEQLTNQVAELESEIAFEKMMRSMFQLISAAG
ncbi:MAG: hypothetical protein EAY75_02850 [Bacteroidetes bacterium]|nr:MAG: hypothetical protein EAY75_02850 [Bacteroidota bacterium]